jgi:hypothetical protein
MRSEAAVAKCGTQNARKDNHMITSPNVHAFNARAIAGSGEITTALLSRGVYQARRWMQQRKNSSKTGQGPDQSRFRRHTGKRASHSCVKVVSCGERLSYHKMEWSEPTATSVLAGPNPTGPRCKASEKVSVCVL